MKSARIDIMKKYLIGILTVFLACPLVAGDTVRTMKGQHSLESGQTLRLDIPVAEISIEGSNRDDILIETRIECEHSSRKCRERAEDIRYDSRSSRNFLDLTLEGFPKNTNHGPTVEIRIVQPRYLPIEIDLGVGELEIFEVEADLRIDLGVGEVEISMPREAIASVEVEVGIGDAELHPRVDHVDRSGFLGSDLSWRGGSGDSEIVIEVGVGDVEIELE
jgi:hypothetical protein